MDVRVVAEIVNAERYQKEDGDQIYDTVIKQPLLDKISLLEFLTLP